MSDEVSIILTLSLLIWVSPSLARLLKLPTTPVEIILGSLAVSVNLLSDNHLFELIAEFGFLYLMFVAGMEVNAKELINIQKATLKRGFAYMALLYLLSIAIALQMGLSLIFMIIFPLVSVGLIATLSKEYGKDQRWIRLSMTIGILAETISIAALTFSSAAIRYGIGFDLIIKIASLLLFLALMVVVFYLMRLLFWWFPEIRNRLMPFFDTQEEDIRLSMAILFILLSIMLYLGLEPAFGTFIAGMFIATFFTHKTNLEERISGFGFGFLIPIFFIYVGSSFPISALAIDGLVGFALMITAIMIAIRMLSAVVFVRAEGIQNAILMALAQSMPLTLLIAIASLAYHGKSIDAFHFYAFILASLFEVLIITTVIKLYMNFKKRVSLPKRA